MIDSPDTIRVSVVVGQVCPEMFWKREQENVEGEIQENVEVKKTDNYMDAGNKREEEVYKIKEMKLHYLITEPIQSKR